MAGSSPTSVTDPSRHSRRTSITASIPLRRSATNATQASPPYSASQHSSASLNQHDAAGAGGGGAGAGSNGNGGTNNKGNINNTASNGGSSSGSSTHGNSDSRPSNAESSPAAAKTPTTMSIDQSVRIFRVFEILRSGDTTAIAKAIRDCADPSSDLLGTTVLHLAIQCTEPQIVEYVLSHENDIDINAQDRDGNTPLHIAAQLGRLSIVRDLLDRPRINDAVLNNNGQSPLDVSRSPEIFQALQLSRSLFMDDKVKEIQALIATSDYGKLEHLLMEPRVERVIDLNSSDLVTDSLTAAAGGTLLHEAARKKDVKLIQILLMHGADPFQRDRKGKLPQDITKDDKTRAILKRSSAAVMAQEKTMLGSVNAVPGSTPEGGPSGGKESREMKGYLKKWTNYTGGYKLRWFVLEDGVLSYYKHQDDTGSACRGAINMRIARLHMDPSDPTRFEIQGKSSVKYHLKANHKFEAKRWFWTLNNAIQWTKDEAKEEEKRRTRDAETFRQAKMEQSDRLEHIQSHGDANLRRTNSRSISQQTPSPFASMQGSSSSMPTHIKSPSGRSPAEALTAAEDEPVSATFDRWSIGSADAPQIPQVPILEADEEVADDYASSKEFQASANKDAFNITAQSLNLQLELLNNVSRAFKDLCGRSSQLTVSDPAVQKGIATYEGTVSNINLLIGDLLKISRDRDAFWQYRLEREVEARKMWENSMARVAEEHEQLQRQMGESEEKRRRQKLALKGALKGIQASCEEQSRASFSQDADKPAQAHVEVAKSPSVDSGPSPSTDLERTTTEGTDEGQVIKQDSTLRPEAGASPSNPRWSIVKSITENLYDDEDSDDDEAEFYDAIDAGDVDVSPAPPGEAVEPNEDSKAVMLRTMRRQDIEASFNGYESGLRKRLKLDADNRPKLSLWGILKSMIGKDMTRMTLPVSFNEPTSLLQRVAEDLEYTDLLDIAADRADSLERMMYVAAFASSEYASTIGRVAKPFNPLLGETYEYVRPDKEFRFVIEQVSHHPPIGAAYAESPKWDYWGESAVKSKFYGKSFDINPLGTWFLRLRPASGGEELYTWKKVTSTVVGIITGNPTIDNYGPMEIKNWTTGEVCVVDFKARGWKVSSAYHVTGKAIDEAGNVKWSLGGRWNDKLFARHTPGFQDTNVSTSTEARGSKAFMIWQANPRPEGIPFNLTPFGVTLNAIDDKLRPHLPPTDTRLRPDQRAMEEGEYDLAAEEKHRVEEKQRAARRAREAQGEEWQPKWFSKAVHDVTGDPYWAPNGEYWKCREKGDWSRCDDIF
ncbi:hypothetical protein KEM52_005428 [Ascosphaera acerosa]|nr:hypothetical protein KEM52_005428 [Ascosphaera acerosa]